MIDEIRQHFAEADVLTEGGRLTLPFVQRYGKERLRNLGLIYGHPGSGVAAYLEGIADTVLLLRDPMDHAISNFLNVLRDPAARLHRAATALGFRDFLHTYPGFLAFQTLSLTTGLGLRVPTDRIYDCLPDVLAYLRRSFLLGTVEQIDLFMASLTNIRRWLAPVSMRHLNQATAAQSPVRDGLKEIYATAAKDTRLATLIAVEQAVYANVRNIAATQRELRSLEALGETARRVWRSPSGEIVLGHNFGRQEVIDAEPAWWTLEATHSSIHLRSATPATLHAEIRIWHAVDPTCVEVWLDERRLDAKIERTGDRFGTLQVPLADQHLDRFATLALRIDRKYVPTVPPTYPALLLYRFRLS